MIQSAIVLTVESSACTSTDRSAAVPINLVDRSLEELLDALHSPERLTRYNAKQRLLDLPADTAVKATLAWIHQLDRNAPNICSCGRSVS